MYELLYEEDEYDAILDGVQQPLARINIYQGSSHEIPEKDVPKTLGCTFIKAEHSAGNVMIQLQYKNIVFFIFRNGTHGQYHFSSKEPEYVNTAA